MRWLILAAVVHAVPALAQQIVAPDGRVLSIGSYPFEPPAGTDLCADQGHLDGIEIRVVEAGRRDGGNPFAVEKGEEEPPAPKALVFSDIGCSTEYDEDWHGLPTAPRAVRRLSGTAGTLYLVSDVALLRVGLGRKGELPIELGTVPAEAIQAGRSASLAHFPGLGAVELRVSPARGGPCAQNARLNGARFRLAFTQNGSRSTTVYEFLPKGCGNVFEDHGHPIQPRAERWYLAGPLAMKIVTREDEAHSDVDILRAGTNVRALSVGTVPNAELVSGRPMRLDPAVLVDGGHRIEGRGSLERAR